MERVDENLEGLWKTARTLWIKYCGVSDEYKMLRERWLYLHGENKLMVLPYLRRKNEDEEQKTFDFLTDHSKKLEGMFGEIGFKRSKMENFSDFKDKVEDLNMDELINRLTLIEEYFYDLSNFVGLLKSAFFQRTVSAEIQHVVSGIPHSPECTIGNELFYLAADNVAWRYCECLNIPYGKWDGFITFIPPIEEGLFYGAFYNPSPYLKLFHVSMSEEAKYFVGSYLALAHEFGHSIMSVKPDLIKKDVYPKWFKTITKEICNRTHRILETNKRDCCKYCHIYKNLYANPEDYEEYYLLLNRNYRVFCSELLADIIAYWIAGKNYVHGFIDAFFQRVSTPNIELLLRVVSTFAYLKIVNEDIKDLKININKLVEAYEYYNSEVLNETYGDEEGIREEDYKCPVFQECVSKICGDWARTINKFDKYDTDYLSEEPENDTITQHLEANKSFFKTIIKDEFRIEAGEATQIISALEEGRPIPEKDPRHIMHCYYEAYKQSDGENRPNYAAAIYSLAFNTYCRNRRE